MRDEQILNPGSITRIQHDGTTLRVHFRSGRRFDYEDVSDNLVSSLVRAESPSRFMLTKILPDRKAKQVGKGDSFPPRRLTLV